MIRLPSLSHASIRTVLLAVLAVLGGWGFFASLQHVADSLRDYSQSRAFSERARVAASLLTAARHLAYERGRSAVVLRGAGPVSEENRAFIDERRRLADAALDTALANPDGLPETVASELEKQHQTIGQLRGLVDRDAALPLASRDSRLADRWYESATGFIGAIQRSVERLAADSRPGDKATRLMLLAASVLQQRITAGGEASRIAQAVAAARPPRAETLYAIHAMRGREDQLWHDIDRLVKAADDGILRGKVEEARKQSAVPRGVQDRALAGLAAPGHVRLPLEQLTAASLPALDGMSELANLAADRAVRMTVEGEAAERLSLLAHGAWSVSILVLLLLSFHYVLRHVVAPLEQADRMLRRGSVLPAGNETRNEIEHLKASAAGMELLEHAISQSSDAVFLIDEAFRFRYVNDAACGSLGYSRDELLTMTPQDIDPDVTREAALAGMERTLIGERIFFESCHRRKDGSLFPVEISASLVEHGGVRFNLAVARDISERKRLETDLLRRGVELRREMDFQHALLDALALVGLQQMVIENGRIVHLGNRKLAHGMGYTDAEIDAHPPLADIIHPDDRARVMDYYRRRMAGEPVPDSYELGLISRDGKRHEYETAVAILPDTDPPRVVTIGRDITERKQAEQRLRDALAFTEGVINAIPDLLFELDRDGTYLNVWAQNPELLAAQKEALLGKTIPDVLDPEAAKVAMSAIREAEEKGCSFGKVLRIELPEGERWFEVSVSRKPAGEEADSRFLTLSRDVTERKASEIAREAALAEAMRLAQMRSAFLAQMSHELRTPLNGILGFAQLLQLQGAMSEEQMDWLSTIQQSGDHLLSLINDILDHAKLEADRMELCPGDIRLDAFLGSIAGIVRVKAEQKQVAFLCETDADLPGVVRGDEKRLRQVLLNLLANAVKFTDHGQVALRVGCPTPGRVRFEVQDSGIGIGENQLEIIFQPFEQAGEASQRAGGTGLGLAISRKLVRLMGGDIEVESRSGEGSLFSFEAGMEAVQAEPTKPEMFAEQTVQALPAAAAEPVFAPPVPELEVLHELARRGNMRSIAQRAAYLAELDPRYGCFARQLGQMAKDYQSKAIVDFVEHYLERMPAP